LFRSGHGLFGLILAALLDASTTGDENKQHQPHISASSEAFLNFKRMFFCIISQRNLLIYAQNISKRKTSFVVDYISRGLINDCFIVTLHFLAFVKLTVVQYKILSRSLFSGNSITLGQQHSSRNFGFPVQEILFYDIIRLKYKPD